MFKFVYNRTQDALKLGLKYDNLYGCHVDVVTRDVYCSH